MNYNKFLLQAPEKKIFNKGMPWPLFANGHEIIHQSMTQESARNGCRSEWLEYKIGLDWWISQVHQQERVLPPLFYVIRKIRYYFIICKTNLHVIKHIFSFQNLVFYTAIPNCCEQYKEKQTGILLLSLQSHHLS